jgi:hypothetical protein
MPKATLDTYRRKRDFSRTEKLARASRRGLQLLALHGAQGRVG